MRHFASMFKDIFIYLKKEQNMNNQPQIWSCELQYLWNQFEQEPTLRSEIKNFVKI